MIRDLAAVLIEQGPAFRVLNPQWTYTAQTLVGIRNTVAIQITVADRPGNTVTKTFHHAIIG